MTRLTRHAALLLALSLLASAATAHAECAWVVWVKLENVNFTPGTVQSDGWETESAAPTYAPSTHAVRRERMASDLLHDWDGALAYERDGVRR